MRVVHGNTDLKTLSSELGNDNFCMFIFGVSQHAMPLPVIEIRSPLLEFTVPIFEPLT